MPFNSNIINVGVEGKFYTMDRNTTADDIITSAEGAFGALIQNLRAGAPESICDSQLPALIAHFEIRTRHLRESFLRTGELLAGRLLDFFSDEDAFAAYMTKKLQADPTILRQAFAEEFAKHGISEDLLDSALQIATPLVPALIQAKRAEFPKLATQLREALPTILKNAAKSGHIKALQNAIAPELRIQRYESLSFSVAKVKDSQIILGDSIVLYSVEGPRPYKAVIDSEDILSAVFLPLDKDSVLIGSPDGKVKGVPCELPYAIARCSLEYFISGENSRLHETLRAQIGIDAHMLEQSEIDEIVGEALP